MTCAEAGTNGGGPCMSCAFVASLASLILIDFSFDERGGMLSSMLIMHWKYCDALNPDVNI